MGGTVEVSWRAIRKAWRAEPDSAAVWLHLAVSEDSETVRARVTEAYQAVQATAGSPPACAALVPAAWGFTLLFGGCPLEELQGWITRFQQRLEEGGVWGSITVERRENPPTWMRPRNPPRFAVTGFVSYATDWETLLARRAARQRRQWSVRPDLTRAVVDSAMGWVAPASGTTTVQVGVSSVRVPDPTGVTDAVQSAAVRGTEDVGVFSATEAPGDFRRFQFGSWGSGIFQAIAAEDSWRQEYETVRRVLDAHAPDTDVAFIRRAISCGQVTWQSLRISEPDLPHVSASDYLNARHLHRGFVPDAHLWQILTPDHLSKAHDLSDWTVTARGDNFVVETQDPAAWLSSGTGPDETTLTKARSDFGEMILTPQALRAHPWP